METHQEHTTATIVKTIDVRDVEKWVVVPICARHAAPMIDGKKELQKQHITPFVSKNKKLIYFLNYSDTNKQ